MTAASGTGGLAEFCATLKDDAIHFGGFVIYGVDVRGNVTSRREKFVQVTWVGANVRVMDKSKVSGQRSAAMAYFRGYHIAYQIMDGDRDDISEAELGKKLLQVGGAHKPKYYDFGGDSGTAAAKEKTRSGTMHGGEVAPGDMKEDDGVVEAAGREDAGGGKEEDGGDTTIAVDVVADVATSPRPRTKSKPVSSVPGTPPPQPPPAAVAKRRASEDAERKETAREEEEVLQEEAATHEAEAAAEELRKASVAAAAAAAAAAAKAAEADAAANAAAADAEMKAERDAVVRVEAERAEQAEQARNEEAAKSAATVDEKTELVSADERATYTRALAAVEGADDTAALEAAMAGWLCVVKSNCNHR